VDNRGAVLGGLALSSAALRNYAITLHAALAPTGVYAGTLTIGGLIERGDIYRAMTADPNVFGGATAGTLNPMNWPTRRGSCTRSEPTPRPS
jgi:hypothetical protein